MEKIGEIDTKPIDSVQAGISLFGAIGAQKNKHKLTSSNGYEKEREIAEANYKVQLEAKDAAFMQALFKLEQQQKSIDELSELLKIAEADRDKYVNECSELKIRQHEEELLLIETELAASRESEVNKNGCLEKEKTVDLIRHISELNEAICLLKFTASEAKKKMSTALFAKDAELELAMEKVVELQKKLEEMSTQTELMHDLESEVLAKMLHTNLGLKQTNELEWSYSKTSSDDLINPKQIKTDPEIMDRESFDQALYIESLEMERNQLKEEVNNANEEIDKFKDEIETLRDQLEKTYLEMDETATITITLEEYHSLIKNVNPTSELLSADNSSHNISSECTDELEKLKKELETAMIRTGEFRSRAEQAATRAEMAEKAKEAIEDQLRKWREHRQRRKAALAAMKEASEPPPKVKPPIYEEGSSKVYQPLGKVLNLKL